MAAPNTAADFIQDRTLRETVHLSLGGPALRIVLSNEFNNSPLTIGAAQVTPGTEEGSPGTQDSSIDPQSSVPITFNGRAGITIPTGAMIVSDPVALRTAPLSDLTVSIFLPGQQIATVTRHTLASSTSYESDGNQVAARTLDQPRKTTHWAFLKGVDVEVPESSARRSASIVILGASIVDGVHSSPGTNRRWTDVFAQRLRSGKETINLGVINEGISGNRLLHDGSSPNALARFDRDVLAQAGVKYLIVADDALNDIGAAKQLTNPHDDVTKEDLIAALSQLAARAHIHGIKIYGATLTPFAGANYYSPAGEAVRQAVNRWIRSTREFDGFIDFDKALRHPVHQDTFLPAYDSGDHLHPNDQGHKAMGEAIDLGLFSSLK